MRDILCNGPKFEIILKLISQKREKYYHLRQKIAFFIFQIQKLDNTIHIRTITGHA